MRVHNACCDSLISISHTITCPYYHSQFKVQKYLVGGVVFYRNRETIQFNVFFGDLQARVMSFAGQSVMSIPIVAWPVECACSHASLCDDLAPFDILAPNSAGIQVIKPKRWSEGCVGTEVPIHQLSPYIGKLKSTIAGDLIERHTRVGDLVLDPFSGSGTIPLEAALRGRNVIAADVSEYAYLLTRAKLFAPETIEIALSEFEKTYELSVYRGKPDLRRVPKWVRGFFHSKTLREIIKFRDQCLVNDDPFLLSCLMGILHHQRPGFLSYPSSHLVPYLRSNKFPEKKFPHLYQYRDLYSRMLKKIKRSYRRPFPGLGMINAKVYRRSVFNLRISGKLDSIITSPPYMNALDYGRDNRLRLWFLGEFDGEEAIDRSGPMRRHGFMRAIKKVATIANKNLSNRGTCILIVGDAVKRGSMSRPSDIAEEVFKMHASSLILEKVIDDYIPDVRRSRRECRGTKKERILIYKRPPE